MKRNVNFLLFGLVIVSMLAMTGMAFYYKATYEELDDRYRRSKNDIMAAAERLNKTIGEVSAKEQLLNQKETVLINYINELNLSKERETSLGAHFVDIKGENEYLNDKLNKTVTDRDKWKISYDTTKNEYDVCRVDYQLKKTESDERLNELIRIRNLKPLMESNADRIGDRKDEVSTNAGRIDDDALDIKNLADGITNETIKSEIKSKADGIRSKVDLIDSVLERLAQNILELRNTISRI